MSDTAAILGLLHADGSAFDGKPEKTPAGPYSVVYDDSGLAPTDRRARTAGVVAWTHRVIAVARTTEGLRDEVARVRNALTGRRPNPAGDLLMEISAGPVLADGPDGDQRLSKTLTYRHHAPRSTS